MQAAINAARGQLPANLPSNPTYRKSKSRRCADSDSGADVGYGDEAADVRRGVHDSGAETSQIEGVGQVFVGGGSRPAVRVEVNPLLLSSLGWAWTRVRTALGSANANSPKGELERQNQTDESVNDNDQLLHAAQYAPLIVAYNNGAPVRLSDVATVVDSWRTCIRRAWPTASPAC